jgi:hypothetical protein
MMLIPRKWLTSESELAEHVGKELAKDIIDELIADAVDEIVEDKDEECGERVRGIVKRAAKRIVAARSRARSPTEERERELLLRLEAQVRAGADHRLHTSPTYDPKEVEWLLNQLDLIRCK